MQMLLVFSFLPTLSPVTVYSCVDEYYFTARKKKKKRFFSEDVGREWVVESSSLQTWGKMPAYTVRGDGREPLGETCKSQLPMKGNRSTRGNTKPSYGIYMSKQFTQTDFS